MGVVSAKSEFKHLQILFVVFAIFIMAWVLKTD
jgi:hypothetical protein